jgi:putative endonuclease
MNKELGILGENIAAGYLRDRGYNIIERNYKNKWAEIDLICLQNKTTVFVEVKTRIGEQFGLPEDAINFKKVKRLVSAASYLAHGPYRIDAICIVLDKENKTERVTHYENITM